MISFNFEFDLEKSEKNKLKHGIDFNEAKNLWGDIFRIVIPTKTIDEEGYILIAE